MPSRSILAEDFRKWSPFTYAVNNPVNITDKDGMSPHYNYLTKQYEDKDEDGNIYTLSWDYVKNSMQLGDNGNHRNYAIFNATKEKRIDLGSMMQDNINWTILTATNGDLTDVAKSIDQDKANGLDVDNVVIQNHGGLDYLAAGMRDGMWVAITAEQVDRYAKSGLTSGPMEEKYLSGIYQIAGAMRKGSDLIFTGCNSGYNTPGQKSLAASIFSMIACTNDQVNVLMPRHETRFLSSKTSGASILFGAPLSGQSSGWTLANKFSNGALQFENSDVQLNKTGNAVIITGQISSYLIK